MTPSAQVLQNCATLYFNSDPEGNYEYIARWLDGLAERIFADPPRARRWIEAVVLPNTRGTRAILTQVVSEEKRVSDGIRQRWCQTSGFGYLLRYTRNYQCSHKCSASNKQLKQLRLSTCNVVSCYTCAQVLAPAMSRQRVKRTHAKTLALRNGSSSDLRLVPSTPPRAPSGRQGRRERQRTRQFGCQDRGPDAL